MGQQRGEQTVELERRFTSELKQRSLAAAMATEPFGINHHTAMRSSTVLRICVVLEWALMGLGLALSFLLESSLPEALRDWLAADAEGDLALHEVALLVVTMPFLACALVGSIGLLFLKRWAAWLYLISLIIGYVLFPFMGPTVEHALADAVDEIAVLLSGLIIGLAFFSDALSVRSAEPSAAPHGGTVASGDNSRLTGGPP